MSKALSVEEGEPGEEAACIVMCLVSHTHVFDTQEQYHNPLCAWLCIRIPHQLCIQHIS